MKASELIVTPEGRIYHLGLRPDELAENVILCGDPDRADRIAGLFDSGTASPPIQNREFRSITGRYQGLPVTIIGTGIGTDNIEIVLIEAYALRELDLASGARRPAATPLHIIRVGTCGTPRPEVDPGALAVSRYAVGLDSTALYFNAPTPDPTAARIEEQVARQLEDAAAPKGRFCRALPVYAAAAHPDVADALMETAAPWAVGGITLTAPGFFGAQGREIPGLPLTVPGLQERLAGLEVDGHRLVNIEMETAMILHLAGMMNYKAGAVCAVIANRATGRFLTDYQPAVIQAAKAALDALKCLDAGRH